MSKLNEARDAYMLDIGTYNGLRDAMDRIEQAHHRAPKAAQYTMAGVHRLAALNVEQQWHIVIEARDAWHAAQDALPIGRSSCRCGCMGRPLEGEAGFDPAAWPGYSARKAV